MTFEIHYELEDGTEDFFVLSGDDIQEIRERALAELKKRGATNSWSREAV